jgi:hypothetical protein
MFGTLAFIMKPKRARPKKPPVITNSRWLAYATAGAASAFTTVNSTEGAIHYSGRIGEYFGPSSDKSARFQLDQPGDSIRLRHSFKFCCTSTYGGLAHFGVFGGADAGFAGFYCPTNPRFRSASKLDRGELISMRPFLARNPGLIAAALFTYRQGQFDSGDLDFIAFKFNNGSGDQYGWVRIMMGTRFPSDYDFWLVDYAYADPGEPIRAGQTSSNDMVPEESNDIVPQEGSLGGLALGAAGLMAWRKRRSRTVRG